MDSSGPEGFGCQGGLAANLICWEPDRRVTHGWAKIAGNNVIEKPAQVRASVGVLTEQHGLYGRMPGDEYLDFFGQIYGMETDSRRQQVDRLLTQFGLDEARHRRVAEYSKGMRQKLALARALIHNPPVLLLDEPTSAMDPESARLVRNSIAELRSAERSIILCTHNLAEAEELADQIAIIRRGKIIAQGSPAGLKQMLLGPGEFEIHLATSLNGQVDTLLSEAEVTARGPNWFRYRTDQPDETNPLLLRSLLDANLPVISVQEVSRSLEQVYLQAITSTEEVGHVS